MCAQLSSWHFLEKWIKISRPKIQYSSHCAGFLEKYAFKIHTVGLYTSSQAFLSHHQNARVLKVVFGCETKYGAIGGQSRDSRPLLQVLAAAFKEVMAGGTANRRPIPNRHGHATGSNDLSRHIYMRLASGRLTISQFLMHTANVACLENCGTQGP